MTLRIMSMRVGKKARYRALRRIGRGGMAETFECIREHRSGERELVCVKRILSAYRGDAELRRLFKEEARFSLDLKHPNIVRAFAAFEDEEGPGIAFELVEGISLRELIDHLRERGGALPIPIIIHLLRSIAEGLDYAHRRRSAIAPRGIIHRDITPSNLLLDLQGQLKISDFGIARALDEARRDQEPVRGPIRGKLAYLAPEYASGASEDTRSDLYSLGIVAYELLALRHPPREARALNGGVRSNYQPSETIERDDVPAALLALVDRLLAVDPDARPKSARATLHFLGALGELPPGVHSSLGALVERCRDARPIETLEKTETLESEATVRLDLRVC